MDNLLNIAFEAHNSEKNHHRCYQLILSRDLLDDWTVTIRYGRTGRDGREIHYAASEAEEMRAIIRDRLRRRLSAPKRIGCPYRLAAFSSAPDFDASVWLPGEVMARFFEVDCSKQVLK
jgi:predicted DNA-binding WGR domain protein